MDNSTHSGRGEAMASMVLGIVSCSIAVVLLLIRLSGILSYLLVGIIGLPGIFLAHSSKANGYTGASQVAGAILSWISSVIGAIAVGVLIFAFTC